MKEQRFIIHGLGGAKTLKGTVHIHGAKNAALKALAAAALFGAPVTLTNVPDNSDMKTLSAIMSKLGAKIERIDAQTLVVDPTGISSTDIDPTMAGSMRASVVLTGPLLGRFGRATFPAPGGCVIGARPIDFFLAGYEQMGATTALDKEASVYTITGATDETGRTRLSPTDLTFSRISVGATETLMMAAVLGYGTTTLRNCAREPEIQNVAEWLNACGGHISGAGTDTITIEGTKGALLKPLAPYAAVPDRIEAGSFLILGALAASDLTIANCRPEHLETLIGLLRGAGVPIEAGADWIRITGNVARNSSFAAFDATTKEYPGLATDLQPIVTAFLTQATGESMVVETIYEGRFKYVDDLRKLGAHIDMRSPQEARIEGPTPFAETTVGMAADADASTRQLVAHDIRAGFAIVMAALLGSGEFMVSNIHLIDRGYIRLDETLRSLGASIERR